MLFGIKLGFVSAFIKDTEEEGATGRTDRIAVTI